MVNEDKWIDEGGDMNRSSRARRSSFAGGIPYAALARRLLARAPRGGFESMLAAEDVLEFAAHPRLPQIEPEARAYLDAQAAVLTLETAFAREHPELSFQLMRLDLPYQLAVGELAARGQSPPAVEALCGPWP